MLAAGKYITYRWNYYMNEFVPASAYGPHSSQEGIEEMLHEIEHLEAFSQQLRALLLGLQEKITALIQDPASGFMFTLKNKFGFSKKDAKKLFYDYIDGKKTDEDNPEPPREPETTEEKISMIMDYMKETSVKLDRIEDELSHLKQQVEEILKRV